MITGNTNPSLSARSSQFQSSKVGCPIRKSTDQRLFAPTRSLSQRTTSFIASYRQGIHQMPFGHLIALISNAHRGHSPDRCLGETQLLAVTIRLGAHCTERPEVIQDKPDPIPRLRDEPEILHIDRINGRCSWNTLTSTSALRDIPSLRCQLRSTLRAALPVSDIARNGKDCSHSHG